MDRRGRRMATKGDGCQGVDRCVGRPRHPRAACVAPCRSVDPVDRPSLECGQHHPTPSGAWFRMLSSRTDRAVVSPWRYRTWCRHCLACREPNGGAAGRLRSVWSHPSTRVGQCDSSPETVTTRSAVAGLVGYSGREQASVCGWCGVGGRSMEWVAVGGADLRRGVDLRHLLATPRATDDCAPRTQRDRTVGAAVGAHRRRRDTNHIQRNL